MSKEYWIPSYISEEESEKTRLVRRVKDVKTKQKLLEQQLAIATSYKDNKGIDIIKDKLVGIQEYLNRYEADAGLYWKEGQACTVDKEPTFLKAKSIGEAKRGKIFIDAARNVCASCEIVKECRNDILSNPNLDNKKYGVVGGMTFEERKIERIKKGI